MAIWTLCTSFLFVPTSKILVAIATNTKPILTMVEPLSRKDILDKGRPLQTQVTSVDATNCFLKVYAVKARTQF
ncbi:hypothetical protein DPMN_183118 [Dreissena polymorpha]|uniref:Secreted protein n=1 Tax=Dreissena polymorpha TaxID=45954 RepID=A0A9D4DHU4_DREPO|nr:hypothetical protein DPMN_183118 [Dreissena polymorpha]